MKKTNSIIVILFLVFCLAHQGIAQEKVKLEVKPKVKPEVKIEHPVFVFESVPEGVHVLHKFVIKNKGDALLHIQDVLPP
ncbi:MAG: hypothetical protein KAH62_04740 [Desulfobacula sp.]|nr:hypothetical protein [Desulfobacula sp.]